MIADERNCTVSSTQWILFFSFLEYILFDLFIDNLTFDYAWCIQYLEYWARFSVASPDPPTIQIQDIQCKS